MIIAEGEYNMPSQVVGLQYLNYEGGKFSKSQKRGVFCEKLPGTGIDPDVLRAYLTFVIPETADTEFKWSDFQEVCNSELLGNYGNYVNRTLTFVKNKLDGVVESPGSLSDEDKKFQDSVAEKVASVTELLEKNELRKAFKEVFALSALGNKYFNDMEPWVVLKSDRNRANDILYNCVRLSRTLAVLIAPFLPNTAARAWKIVGLEGVPDAPGTWDNATDSLGDKHEIGEPEVLFQRITDEFIEDFGQKVSDASDVKSLFQ